MKTIKIFCIFVFLITIAFSQNTDHKVGKILFSKQFIEKENDPSITNSFSPTDNIYALLVLEDIAKNYYSDPMKIEGFELVFDFLDETPKNLYYTTGRIKQEELNKKNISLEILPDPNTITSYSESPIFYKRFGNKDQGSDGPIGIALRLKTLPPGKQRVHVTLNLNYTAAAKGEFEINASDFKVYEEIAQKLIEGANKITLKEAKMPEAKKSDKNLEKQMITAIMNSNDWKSGFIKGKSILKLVIIDPDWIIRRNEFTGVILHRYIRAAAAIQGPDGKCRVYKLITFQQDYSGGNYKPLRYDGVGDSFEIECDKVK